MGNSSEAESKFEPIVKNLITIEIRCGSEQDASEKANEHDKSNPDKTHHKILIKDEGIYSCICGIQWTH